MRRAMLKKVGRLEEILENINRGEVENVNLGADSNMSDPVETWRDCLVKALTEMPSDLSARILASIPKDLLVDILGGVNNPYVKLALLLMKNV